MRAVDDRRAGGDAIVIRWIKLGLAKRLLTAGGAAGEIGVARRLAVKSLRDLFAGDRHQMGRAKAPIAPFHGVTDDSVAVQRGRGSRSLIGVDDGVTATQARRQDGVVEHAAIAAVPGSFEDALPSVLRQPHFDADRRIMHGR